jgi:hypothetical protein
MVDERSNSSSIDHRPSAAGYSVDEGWSMNDQNHRSSAIIHRSSTIRRKLLDRVTIESSPDPTEVRLS